MLTATSPIPRKRVSPLKMVFRKPGRGSGVSIRVGMTVGVEKGVLVDVGDGIRVGVAVSSPGVTVVCGVSSKLIFAGMIKSS